MSKRLLHAQHNESVCHDLCQKDGNVDWVVTTAFYSALHYLEHKIFPLSEKDANGHKFKVKTFDQYYSLHHNNGILNKHLVRVRIAEKYIPLIAPHYKWLKDTCWNARYYEYQFPNPVKTIEEVKRRLLAIKQICESST